LCCEGDTPAPCILSSTSAIVATLYPAPLGK
jgi:hypothetical protein